VFLTAAEFWLKFRAETPQHLLSDAGRAPIDPPELILKGVGSVVTVPLHQVMVAFGPRDRRTILSLAHFPPPVTFPASALAEGTGVEPAPPSEVVLFTLLSLSFVSATIRLALQRSTRGELAIEEYRAEQANKLARDIEKQIDTLHHILHNCMMNSTNPAIARQCFDAAKNGTRRILQTPPNPSGSPAGPGLGYLGYAVGLGFTSIAGVMWYMSWRERKKAQAMSRA
jgi:hypothetical protein